MTGAKRAISERLRVYNALYKFADLVGFASVI